MRKFVLAHLNRADANDLWALLDTGLTPGDPELRLIEHCYSSRDWRADVSTALGHWFSDEAACLSGTRLRGGVLQCRAPDREADDMIYLVGRAARAFADDVAQEFMQDVRKVLNLDDASHASRLTRHVQAVATGSSDRPPLMFAYHLGASMREFAGNSFSDTTHAISLTAARSTANGCIYRALGPFISSVRRADVASLVAAGLGDAAFGAALWKAGAFYENGAFGAVELTVREHIRYDDRDTSANSFGAPLLEIANRHALANVAPGYRILVIRDTGGSRRPIVCGELLSMGGGKAAGWLSLDNMGRRRWPDVYRLIDISRDNDWLHFADGVFTLTDQARVGVWIDPAAQGVLSGATPAPLSPGQPPDGRLFPALKNNEQVKTALQKNLEADPGDLLFLGSHVAPEIVSLMEAHGITDVKYRLVAAWDQPLQRKPGLSVALTGMVTGVRPGVPLHPLVPDNDSAPERHAVIVDLFAPRVLGGGNGVSSVGYVSSEADWRDVYARHAGNRCIKYWDFDTAADMLARGLSFQWSPGISAFDPREGAYLLHVPDWSHFPQPGWHPDRP